MTERDLELYYKGIEALEENDSYKALSLFLLSKDKDPHFKTFEQIAVLLAKLNMNEESYQYIGKAYEINPRNSKTATLFAESLVDHGDFSQAKDIITKVLNENDSYGPAKRLLEKLISSGEVEGTHRHLD